MEDLPDEILLRIFAFIHDGIHHSPPRPIGTCPWLKGPPLQGALTLLDAVPLVCRRWHRLSRDPQAWSGIYLSVSTMDMMYWMSGQEPWLPTCRVLLRAPALRFLAVPWYSEPWATELHAAQRDLLSALRRSRALLHEVALEDSWRDALPAEVHQALLALVWRSRLHVRKLTTCLPLWDGEALLTEQSQPQQDVEEAAHVAVGGRQRRDSADGGPDEETPPLLTSLVLLPTLQHLEMMHLTLNTHWKMPYDGELATGLPRLRFLQCAVNPSELSENERGSLRPLQDLIVGSSASLRDIRLTSDLEKDELLVASVSRCSDLRRLSTRLLLVQQVLPALPHLKELSVGMHDSDFKGDTTKKKETRRVAATLQFLRQGRCEALAGLQRLSLSVHGMFYDERTRSVKQWPRPNSPPMELLQALLRAVPAADLDLHMEPDIEALLFDSMLSP